MTAKQDFEAFLNAQKVDGYTLGDIEGSPEADMTKYTELKVEVAQEEEKVKNFQSEKQVAFDALAVKHDKERIALGIEWQALEDAL